VRPYEVGVILDLGLEDDQIRAIIDRAVDTIKAEGGAPGRIDRWGRRRFAYRLKHRWEGYYVFIEAYAEPKAMEVLDRQLTLNDGVLRHRVIRLPDHVAGRERRPLTPEADEQAEAAPSEVGAAESRTPESRRET
jgi:small subunit ribosomal protein S6